MTLRKCNVRDMRSVAYAFEPPIGGEMVDVGRTLGTSAIGLSIQTIAPGCFSSRRHRHHFQEELLVVMSGSGALHHGDEALPVATGDAVAYLAGDPDPHNFENTGKEPLVIWAFGNRLVYEVCAYPDQKVAFVEALGAEVPLDGLRPSEWTEEARKR